MRRKYEAKLRDVEGAVADHAGEDGGDEGRGRVGCGDVGDGDGAVGEGGGAVVSAEADFEGGGRHCYCYFFGYESCMGAYG